MYPRILDKRIKLLGIYLAHNHIVSADLAPRQILISLPIVHVQIIFSIIIQFCSHNELPLFLSIVSFHAQHSFPGSIAYDKLIITLHASVLLTRAAAFPTSLIRSYPVGLLHRQLSSLCCKQTRLLV